MSDSYSQYGEDLIVAEIFGYTFIGTMLEIGAWGVKDLSNSRLFIERGWLATLVELSPMPVHALLMEYGSNSLVRIIQAAITPDRQPVMAFHITENALSTSDEGQKNIWDKTGKFYGQLWVPTISVQQLLDQFFGGTKIDYASVDTEGTSVDLALALMATDWRPRVVVVEFNDKLQWLLQEAQRWGYKAHHVNGTNVILVR
jgi:hypothetical protein